MNTKTVILTRNSFAGLAAIAAGTIYIARWGWEIKEGVLKNMQHAASFTEQYFFLVKLLFIIALLGLYYHANNNKRAKVALILVCSGLTWTAITRTLEAYGAPGPWGFYSSPGILFQAIGLMLAGRAMRGELPTHYMGKLTFFIGSFYFLGCFSSMLLFNILGRNDQANHIASVVANLFFIAEGVVWILLGLLLRKRYH